VSLAAPFLQLDLFAVKPGIDSLGCPYFENRSGIAVPALCRGVMGHPKL
jgi:hypothetical protein